MVYKYPDVFKFLDAAVRHGEIRVIVDTEPYKYYSLVHGVKIEDLKKWIERRKGKQNESNNS